MLGVAEHAKYHYIVAEQWGSKLVIDRVAKIEQELALLAEAPDEERIHDTRVAGRRLRAALRHLEDAFIPGDAERLRGEVAKVASLLGDIRDLDVLVQSLAPEMRRPKSPFHALLASLSRSRARRLAKVAPAAAVLGRRLAWWRGRLESAKPSKPPAVADFPKVYEKLVRRYFRQGAKLVKRHAGPEELHRFRIKTKRLRYVIELYCGKDHGMKAELHELQTIQKVLGNLQDQSMIVNYFERRLMDVRTPQRQTEYLRVLHRARMKQAAFRQAFFSRWARLEQTGIEKRWIEKTCSLK